MERSQHPDLIEQVRWEPDRHAGFIVLFHNIIISHTLVSCPAFPLAPAPNKEGARFIPMLERQGVSRARLGIMSVSFAKLRLVPIANKQEKNVRWAKDYELEIVARPAGFEPTATRLEGACSIH